MRSGNKGFTLIEALVSAALVGIGVSAALGGFGALARAQADLQERERMYRLARGKYDELIASGITNAPSTGDFKEWNEERYTWEFTAEPSGVDNLDAVTVDVVSADGRDLRVQIHGLVFTAPVVVPVEEAP